MNKNLIKILIALAILGISLAVYQTVFAPDVQVGQKDITIEVVDRRTHPETTVMKSTTYTTQAQFLGELIDQINEKTMTFTLTGNKSDTFGRMLTSIKGIEQNTNANQYWMYESLNNAECVKSGFCSAMDQLPIYDQDHFVFYIQ